MGERVWTKFHSIFGPDLKVGFETTFPKGAEPKDLDPLYKKSGLIHNPPNERVMRVYEPARVMGSCCDGRAADILFVPVSRKGAIFRRLMFARKIEGDGRARRWMVAGRHGEAVPFGFDFWNSMSQRYLALAYPDQEEFTPTFVKIQNVGTGGFVYLELWAWDDEVQLIITARRVNEDTVPEHLLLAAPWDKPQKSKVLTATIGEVVTA